MATKNLKFYLTVTYIVFATLFFIFFHFTNLVPYKFEFAFIVINFVFGLFFLLLNKHTKVRLLIVLGLFFTVIADTFLVVFRGNSSLGVWGVLFFCLAQIAYTFFIHYKENKKKLLLALLLRIIPILIIVIVLYSFFGGWEVFTNSQSLILITGSYVVLSLVNIIFGFINYKRCLLLAIGLVLLFLCDIFVGLGFLNISMPFNFAWLFYIPSQAFVVMHLTKK